jgi:KipI family sensor histidine kinase inhibitor
MDTGTGPDVHVDRFGERALLVRAADQATVLGLAAGLAGWLAGGRLLDVVPGDRSLLVTFDGSDAGEATARDAIAATMAHPVTPPTPRHHLIPVRYGSEEGPDLADAASLAGVTPDELVALHTAGEHPVLFLGFAPGFPYIGDLAPELVLPRLATPRTSTPAGSVGIAEAYTGIYPAPLPAGWRIIGRTAMSMFDPAGDPPTTLLPGDLVRFEAVR